MTSVGFVAIDSSCYAIISDHFNWNEAHLACKSLHSDAHLVVASTPEKQAAVKAIVAHMGM